MSLTRADKTYIHDTVTSSVIHAIEELVIPRFDEINARFAKQDERFAKQDKRFAEQDKKFAKQDKRFEEQDKRFAKQDERFDRIDRELHTIRVRIERMDIFLGNAEGRLKVIESDIKDLYYMYKKQFLSFFSTSRYVKLSVEEKLIILENELRLIANKEGITLSQHPAK